MKKYTKNGVTRYANEINIVKDGIRTFHPSHNLIIEDGWVEVVPAKEDLTANARKNKKDDIKRYDESFEVNEFYIDNVPMWLDKATRAGLKLRFEAEVAIGKTETTLWNGGMQFTLPLDKAMQMLYALEVYASMCYDCTQAHYANVATLKSVEDIESYDHTTGYPEKLKFESSDEDNQE